MSGKTHGYVAGNEILRILGIEPNRVKDFSIRFPMHGAATVELERHLRANHH
jgi:hypothetical protein